MGAPTDVLSPKIFRAVVYSHLKKIFDSLKALNCPTILHMCGDTNPIMTILKETGPLAISVEQKNNLESSRKSIGWDTLLFGNVDAYNVLVKGTPKDVEGAVVKSINGGVDAVWPSCDIWPTAPLENLKTMVETVKRYGAKKQAVRN
jgi:[methyl-Co(III) methanol-specific corrinoid protein]:coenzyme M methyltransferase